MNQLLCIRGAAITFFRSMAALVGPDESGSKSSCPTHTLRFLRSVCLALMLLTTINRDALKAIRPEKIAFGKQ